MSSYNSLAKKYDNRYTSLVGWQPLSGAYDFYWSDININYISSQVTFLLKKSGYHIKVTDEVIGGIMSDIIRSQNPKIGDIYTRYIIPDEEGRDDIASMTNQVITVIVNNILSEQETIRLNSRLTIWSTVLGDFNKEGLRSHDILKTKENDYIKGVFNMNY